MLRLCFKIIAAGPKKGLPLFSVWRMHSSLCSRLDVCPEIDAVLFCVQEKIVNRRRSRLHKLDLAPAAHPGRRAH
jgi:hypothetical protein